MNNAYRYLAAFLLAVIFSPVSPARGQSTASRTKESVAKELDEVARIATVMLDGDNCRKIMTRRALEKMFAQDPKDPWAASDNFEVNYEPFIQTKKTLIRLSRLLPYPCDVNLWMPFQDRPDKVQILIRNANEWSQFWTWGILTQDIPLEMKRVLETGKREKVARRPGMISILAPVYDSMGDIVALIEAVAMEPGIVPPQVHAKNGEARAEHSDMAVLKGNDE